MSESDPRPLNSSTLATLGPAVSVPRYRRDRLTRSIVHIGVGGFHRSHLAAYIHDLGNRGNEDWSIVGAGVLPGDAAMAEALASQDFLYSLIVRSVEETSVAVIGSIVDYVLAYPDAGPLIERIARPETAIVSLTVTEGGYPVDDETGLFNPQSPMAGPGSAFTIVAKALDRRRKAGHGPITIVSCDNIMSNGKAARTATRGEAATLDPSLADWIDSNVGFPNSMVDRITPATTDRDRRWLADHHGILDRAPVVAEPFRQWVIEDRFAAAVPPLADVGVLLTGDVEPYERLKLRLLNASHSCLAYLAALLDIELVDEAMAVPEIRLFVETFLDEEAGVTLPVVEGIDLASYKQSLLIRFANPHIGDQVARLCLDGSAKFPKFLLPTIQTLLDQGRPIDLCALALAGWCQYLVGQSENGKAIEHASDPRLDAAIGHARASTADPRAFLAFSEVFSPDLAQHPVLVEAFEHGLSLLRSVGVRSAIDTILQHRD